MMMFLMICTTKAQTPASNAVVIKQTIDNTWVIGKTHDNPISHLEEDATLKSLVDYVLFNHTYDSLHFSFDTTTIYLTIADSAATFRTLLNSYQPLLNYTAEDVSHKIGVNGTINSTNYFNASAINTFNNALYTAITDSVLGRQKYSDTLTFDVTLAHLNVILSGYLKTEVDPVFTASPAYGISNGNISNWNTAYNKYVTGIGFSGGILTLTKNDATTLTQSLDGRYIYYTDTPAWIATKYGVDTGKLRLTTAINTRQKYSDTSTYDVTLAHLNIILGGYTLTSTTITINGVVQDLSTNRSWTVGDLLSSGSYSNPSWITALGWSKITSTPTTVSGYGITDVYTKTASDARYAQSITLNTTGVLYTTPVTFTNNGSGVFTASLTLATQSANLVFRSGAGGTPTFSSLLKADLPADVGYTDFNQVWTKSQSSQIVDIAYSATVTPDFSLSNDYRLPLTGNFVLGTPTNLVEGQKGSIDIFQDQTGSRLLSSSSWAWCWQGGLLPALTTTKMRQDLLTYKVSTYRTSTVTMSLTNPGVVTWNNHGLQAGMKIQFTTSGALPTGITANTTYWVVNTATNTFQLASSDGSTTGVQFSGSQSGTHTGTSIVIIGNIINDFR
jgi:hypothetical protein